MNLADGPHKQLSYITLALHPNQTFSPRSDLPLIAISDDGTGNRMMADRKELRGEKINEERVCMHVHSRTLQANNHLL